VGGDEVDLVRYELRYGASWAAGTVVETTEAQSVVLRAVDLPTGQLTLRLRAVTVLGVYSDTELTATIINDGDEIGDRLQRLRDRLRRVSRDVDGELAADLFDDGGLTRLINVTTRELTECKYPSGERLEDREPIQGAAEQNLAEFTLQMEHGDELDFLTELGQDFLEAPQAEYLGNAMERQGAAKWGTKAAVDADTASTAAPTTYGTAPSFEVTPQTIKANLYLQSDAAPTQRSEAFGSPSTLVSVGQVSGVAAPTTNIPASDDLYRAAYSGQCKSTKAGSLYVWAQLQVDTGTGFETVATQVHNFTATIAGQLFEFGGTLIANVGEFASGDEFRGKLTGGGVLATSDLELVLGNLIWYTSSSIYASMTPNGQKALVRVRGRI
jgi:hypothetical protein